MNKEQFLAMSWKTDLAVLVDTKNWFEKRKPFVATLIGLFDFENLTVKYIDDLGATYTSNTGDFTPICRPLSDLTKDEWIDKLNTFACELFDAAHVYDEKNIIGLNWMTQPFEIVMWLVKNHFNIMDESEPFIDVNTLPENPYK